MASAGTMFAELGIGMAMTIIGMAPFFKEWNTAPQGAYNTVEIGTGIRYMNVSAGEHDPNAGNFGGDMPGFALFSGNGARIGMKQGGTHVNADNFKSVEVPSIDQNNDQAPEYITVSQSGKNIDAICLAHVTTKSKRGDHYSIAVGEVAAMCNTIGYRYPWYPSSSSVQLEQNGNEQTVHPKCVMLDTPDDHNQRNSPYAGFAAHLIDFKLDASIWKQWEGDLHQMCDSNARFWMYESLNELQCPRIFLPPEGPPTNGQRLPMLETTGCYPDVWHPDIHTNTSAKDALDIAKDAGYTRGVKHCKKDALPMGPVPVLQPASDNPACPYQHNKRRNTQGRIYFHERLVRSNIDAHSAIEVCNDKATRGPDFFSEAEQKLCHMSTHEIYDACNSTVVTKCFDTQQHKIRFDGQLETRDDTPAYRHKEHWGY